MRLDELELGDENENLELDELEGLEKEDLELDELEGLENEDLELEEGELGPADEELEDTLFLPKFVGPRRKTTGKT